MGAFLGASRKPNYKNLLIIKIMVIIYGSRRRTNSVRQGILQ